MGTEKKSPACTLCENVSDASCNDNSIEEFIVLDYRQKVANHLGFPSGTKHTVQGWKIKHSSTIHTYVCDECANQYLEKIKRHAPLKAIITGGITLILLTTFIYMIATEVENEYGDYGNLILLLFIISIIVFVIFLSRVFSEKSFIIPTLQRKALKKLLGPKLKQNYGEPEKFPKFKGLIFHIANEKWKNFENRINEIEAQTGWSYIHYTYESTLGGTQICTLEQGASLKNVEHLGIYLGAPDETLPAPKEKKV